MKAKKRFKKLPRAVIDALSAHSKTLDACDKAQDACYKAIDTYYAARDAYYKAYTKLGELLRKTDTNEFGKRKK